jgi:hypothetical protein
LNAGALQILLSIAYDYREQLMFPWRSPRSQTLFRHPKTTLKL